MIFPLTLIVLAATATLIIYLSPEPDPMDTADVIKAYAEIEPKSSIVINVTDDPDDKYNAIVRLENKLMYYADKHNGFALYDESPRRSIRVNIPSVGDTILYKEYDGAKYPCKIINNQEKR